MPARIILTICFMLLQICFAQQTSTDTSWKLKYRQQGIPDYRKRLKEAL